MRKLLLASALFAFPVAALPPGDCQKFFDLSSVETEAKFLLPDLAKLPAPVLHALENGLDDPFILERGFTLQEYLPVTPENLELALKVTRAAGMAFGTPEQQKAMSRAGVAQEIRVLTRSIKIAGRTRRLYLLTIKAAGGVAVTQLETPETPQDLFAELSARATGEVRKLSFKLARFPSPVEVDVFLNSSRSPFFINGEVEFHASTTEQALAQAHVYRAQREVQPEYLGEDITDSATNLRLKTRDLTSGAIPAEIDQLFRVQRESNRAIVNKIGAQFATWADLSLVRRVWDHPPVHAEMIDPLVFASSQTSEILAHFKQEGYVVVDQISSPNVRSRVVKLMDKIAKIPAARRAGFMDFYHDDSLAQLRQEPSLVNLFSTLFNNEKLWVVFDRLMYWNPSEGDLPLAPHVDQNPLTHPEFFAAQGMLALKDMNENTGTLALSPGSHLRFSNYSRWARPSEGYVEYRGVNDLDFVGIRLRAGQIVIWDSRTTHSRFRGQAADTRYAALVTFTPAVDDETLRTKRLVAYQHGVGESDHAAGLRATARPRSEQSLRQTAEKLTALGRKLYGVDSWFTR